MTLEEFDTGWRTFRGTFRLFADDLDAYWTTLKPMDAPAWVRVATWYANNTPAGSQVPSPFDVRNLVAREASNATFASGAEDCPCCDHGQILIWRADWTGQHPSYFAHNVDPWHVADCTPYGCEAFRLARTTVSCTCHHGRSLRAAQQTAKRPVLASFQDRTGMEPSASVKAPWTVQGVIEQAIRETIANRRAVGIADRALGGGE